MLKFLPFVSVGKQSWPSVYNVYTVFVCHWAIIEQWQLFHCWNMMAILEQSVDNEIETGAVSYLNWGEGFKCL